jgi:hypothetical protein
VSTTARWCPTTPGSDGSGSTIGSSSRRRRPAPVTPEETSAPACFGTPAAILTFTGDQLLGTACCTAVIASVIDPAHAVESLPLPPNFSAFLRIS